jgi:hypothetical protein
VLQITFRPSTINHLMVDSALEKGSEQSICTGWFLSVLPVQQVRHVPITPVHHVVTRTGILQSQFAGNPLAAI